METNKEYMSYEKERLLLEVLLGMNYIIANAKQKSGRVEDILKDAKIEVQKLCDECSEKASKFDI